MKSTDMFLSAEGRHISKQPIVLSSSHNPKGLAPSPFVVSLWETKKIPQKLEEKQHNEELETIEDLFRGNGRVSFADSSSISSAHISAAPAVSDQRSNSTFPHSSSLFAPSQSVYSNLPSDEKKQEVKQIKIPSREEQLKKMEKSKNEYSAIFKNPSRGSSGFFRNFAFWK